ncbi:MAG TPA: redoxin family protein [Acidimicrobiales bacterium]|nr:redoxin family protein [Acidimicrobiales bacterium]
MPEVPRFGWRLLLASTVLALLAATATFVLLDDGPSEQNVDDGAIPIPLVPDTGAVEPDAARFTEFDGTEVALASLRGGPVVVNFFASYCTPCITEMPALEEVHQQLGDQVTFLGLAVADREDEASELIERTGVTYRTAQDRDSSVITALGGSRLPTTVLLAADGSIAARHSGQLDADDLRQLLADELGIRP